MTSANPESTPKASIHLDKYGNAAKEYVRSRTSASSVAFFLGHPKRGMMLLDCGCGEGTITIDLAEVTGHGKSGRHLCRGMDQTRLDRAAGT